VEIDFAAKAARKVADVANVQQRITRIMMRVAWHNHVLRHETV